MFSSLILIALAACCPPAEHHNVYVIGGGTSYGDQYYSGVTVDIFWDVPYDAYDGWLGYYLDELCDGSCTGELYLDDLLYGGIEIPYAPEYGYFELWGWYQDSWGYWYNVCDDLPYVTVDGYEIAPYDAVLYVDDWDNPVDCVLFYYYEVY